MMRKTQKSLWLAPLPGNILLTQPLPYLTLMVRLFPTSSPISSTTTTSLPALSFHDSFKSLSSSFLHFPLNPVLDSSSISLSNPPSYSDYLLFSLMLLWTEPLPLYPTLCLHLHLVLCPFLTLSKTLTYICFSKGY